MKLQTIRTLEGKEEYVLLPVQVYQMLKKQIDEELTALDRDDEYIPFELKDYVDNPIALARINARISQAELAKRLGVSQAYVSKIEHQKTVTAKLLARVQVALEANPIEP